VSEPSARRFISRLTSSCYAIWKGSPESPTSSTSQKSVCVSRPVVPAPFLSLFSLERVHARPRAFSRLNAVPFRRKDTFPFLLSLFQHPRSVIRHTICRSVAVSASDKIRISIDRAPRHRSASRDKCEFAVIRNCRAEIQGPVKAAARARAHARASVRGVRRGARFASLPLLDPSLSPDRRSGGVLEFGLSRFPARFRDARF